MKNKDGGKMAFRKVYPGVKEGGAVNPGARARKWMWVFLAVMVVAALGIGGIVMTFREKQEQGDTVLRFLLFGQKPDGMEEVLEEFYRRTKDTLGIRIEMEWVARSSEYKVLSDVKLSGKENYDLVFDADWIHLYEMQERGVYLDLSPYLDNPEYPGLRSAFSRAALENNRINGEQCALPVFRTYGSGIPCIYYRKDLALKYGIPSIDSVEDMQAYMEALLAGEPDMIPLVLNGSRGFFGFHPESTVMTREQARRLVYPITIGEVTVVVQMDESLSEIEAVGMMGDEEGFSGFMEGLQFDFLIGRLQGYRNWNRYCEEDVLNRTDQVAVFQSGQGGAYISTLDDYEEVSSLLEGQVPGASLGVYIISDAIRNREERAIGTSYRANNYICIPAFSEHVEETVRFLDWLYASEDNHDLFEHGIEGTHWRAVGGERYEMLADEKGNYYVFPGYAMTWNTHYVKFPVAMPEDILAYRKYELQESTFFEKPLNGFVFDESRVRRQMVKVTQILNRVWPALRNGILDDPEGVLRTAVEEAKENGLKDILEELERQLQEFLDRRQDGNS